MRFARWSFGLAAAYGLPATLSLYGRAPLDPARLWLFGFAGAAFATQLLYVALAFNPLGYRRLIPIGIVSKLSFAIPVALLWTRGGVPGTLALAGLVDFALAALFALNWQRLRAAARVASPTDDRVQG